MKIGRLFILAGIAVGVFVAFWLLSQRRDASYAPEHGREISPDWLELE